MKKRVSTIIVTLLVLALTMTSALGVFAEGENQHVHSWSAWTVESQPTYVHEGLMVRTCSTCGAEETLPTARIPAYSRWITENGGLYYFGSDGQMYVGWHKMKPYNTKKVKWCYFNENGVYTASINKNTKNKWVKAGGRKFYFNKKKRPVGQGFNFIKNKLYYMDYLGGVVYGTFVATDGYTYTANKYGQISGLAFYKHKYKQFVLIDISDQKLSFYKNGKRQLHADVVTGKPGRWSTPTGTFKVRRKRKYVTLTGATWSNPVTYWMPFKGDAYGMHDASWRTSREFSNHKTYINNGSHGCVNMRFKDAKALYGMVKKGTVVIIQK